MDKNYRIEKSRTMKIIALVGTKPKNQFEILSYNLQFGVSQKDC